MRTNVPSLVTFLAEIPEYRNAQGKRYSLVTLLVYVCVAMLCGRRSQAAIADWGTDYGPAVLAPLGIEGERGPSQATIHRLFKQVSRDKLEEALSRWAEAVLQAHSHDARDHLTGPAFEGMAIDGKTLRGSKKQGAHEAHLLSALSHRLQVVLGQVAVDDKSNEITAIDKRLTLVGVAGRVTTTDALHTHRQLAQAILDDGGDDMMVVKENQPTLLEDIVLVFEHADVLADTISETRSSSLHGDRLEERHLCTSTALVGYSDWPGVQQVMKLERIVTNKRTWHVRREVAYAVTSLPPARAAAHHLLCLWRAHWCIENKLHYVRDVTFDEDRAQVRTGHIPQVMAAFRNLAISILRLLGYTNIAAACRRFAARPALALAAVGFTMGT
jgi:predicted transposase YbfD/YdcC